MASFQTQSPPAVPPSLRADAELVLTAVRRIEAAIDGDRAGLPADFLRAHLRAMDETIAQARLELALDAEYGARTVDIESLLAELSEGIAAAARIVDPYDLDVVETPRAATAGAASPDREPDREPQAREQVPTVSNVVSQLGRSSAALMPLADFSASSFGRPDQSSIDNLQDLVRALGEPEPAAGAAALAPPDMADWTREFAPAAPILADARDVPASADVSTNSDPVLADEAVVASSEMGPVGIPSISENLVDSPSAAMLPVLEPEAETYGPARPIAEETSDAAISSTDTAFLVAEPSAPEIADPPIMPEPDLLSNFERMKDIPFLPPEEGSAVIFPPRDPEAEASHGSAKVAVPESQPHCPASVGPAPPAAPEQDVTTFLFGSTESDTEPSEFLLDFSGLAAISITIDSQDPATAEAQPPANVISVMSAAPGSLPLSADPAPAAPRDPLAALKAMSDVERIALFG